jgi:hypothetical protein
VVGGDVVPVGVVIRLYVNRRRHRGGESMMKFVFYGVSNVVTHFDTEPRINRYGGVDPELMAVPSDSEVLYRSHSLHTSNSVRGGVDYFGFDTVE